MTLCILRMVRRPVLRQWLASLIFLLQGTVPYPRIIIGRDLPRQNASKMSPATLWLWGASHSITSDGTTDRELVLLSLKYYREMLI